MLQLSRKTLYALEAVVDIAYNARPDPVQSKEITERQGIPQRYLEQVMQQLVRAGILRGVRGPRGGYRLARERRRITVADVVRVVAETDTNDTGEGTDADCGSALGHQVVRPLLGELQAELTARLEAITIEDLCQRANAVGIPAATREHADFAI